MPRDASLFTRSLAYAAEDRQEELDELIARHVVLTGSTIGARVLDAWPERQRAFTAVTPRDFKRVREAEAQHRLHTPQAAPSHLVGA